MSRPSTANRVSVIMPTRNRDTLLREALASVIANRDARLDLEVLVIDNGRGAETRSIAAEFGARYLRCDIQDIAAARNRGIEVAMGDYVTFLDDDDVWTPGHLAHQVRWLAERPDFDAVIGQVQNMDFELARRGLLWPADLPADGRLFSSLLRVQPQLGATVIRRSAVRAISGFDESLPGDEDWDFHLRVALGHKVGFVAIPCVLYRGRAEETWDEAQWTRMAMMRMVYWTNVRRAGMRRPSYPFLLRTYLHHLGRYHSILLRRAQLDTRNGDRRASRFALRRAMRISPLHTAWSLVRDPAARWVTLNSFGPRPRSSQSGPGPAPAP